MIQVLLEVRTGATRSRVSARARSIQRAVNIAGARYPSSEVRLVVPVEAETFFVGDASRQPESIGFQMPESLAG
jgi:hypothetical protein